VIARAIAQSASAVLHQVAQYQKPIAVSFQGLHDGSHLEAGPYFRREPPLLDNAIRNVNEPEANRRFHHRARTGHRRHHGVQQRQRKRRTHSSQEGAAG